MPALESMIRHPLFKSFVCTFLQSNIHFVWMIRTAHSHSQSKSTHKWMFPRLYFFVSDCSSQPRPLEMSHILYGFGKNNAMVYRSTFNRILLVILMVPIMFSTSLSIFRLDTGVRKTSLWPCSTFNSTKMNSWRTQRCANVWTTHEYKGFDLQLGKAVTKDTFMKIFCDFMFQC